MGRISATLLGIYYAYMLEYRAELLFWALSGSLPIILMGVWAKAGESGQFSLDTLQLIRYFVAVFLVRQMTAVWVIWEFEKEIVQGKLSPRLLQPLDPAWHHMASHLSERLARLPFIVGLMALCFWLYPQAVWLPSVSGAFFGISAIFLAFAMRFLIQYTFAMMAFWTERASSIEQLWFLLYLFLSGYAAPLELFPPLIREIALWTPFPYLLHFPAALLVGLPVNVAQGFGIITLWSGVFWVWNRWLWREGLRQYSGMGA